MTRKARKRRNSGLPFRWCRICGLPCFEEPAKAGRCCSHRKLRELSAGLRSLLGSTYPSHTLPHALRSSLNDITIFLRRLHSWLNSRLYGSLQCWDNWLVIWLHSWRRRARRSVRSALLELAAAFLFETSPGRSFRACNLLCSRGPFFRQLNVCSRLCATSGSSHWGEISAASCCRRTYESAIS